VQEAGLDGFWIHRALEIEGIESHFVDPASIATSRRRRRAKTDKIDGEALVRTLLAYNVNGGDKPLETQVLDGPRSVVSITRTIGDGNVDSGVVGKGGSAPPLPLIAIKYLNYKGKFRSSVSSPHICPIIATSPHSLTVRPFRWRWQLGNAFAQIVVEVVMLKITGLNELQRKMDELAKFGAELDGEIAQVTFDPTDPTSIEAAIQEVADAVDAKAKSYPRNEMVQNLAEQA
jgi:hypothetical protein